MQPKRPYVMVLILVSVCHGVHIFWLNFFNLLPNNKTVDYSRLKAFTDGKIIVTEKLKLDLLYRLLLERETILKWRSWYFCLSPKCFPCYRRDKSYRSSHINKMLSKWKSPKFVFFCNRLLSQICLILYQMTKFGFDKNAGWWMWGWTL